jgi:hypothetical protein
MTKVVMTGSSAARSAKAENPTESSTPNGDYAFFRKEFFNGIGEQRTFLGTGPNGWNAPKSGGCALVDDVT